MGSSLENYRLKALSALGPRLQLGADPVTMSQAMSLCGRAGINPHKILRWTEKLLTFLCKEKYLVKQGPKDQRSYEIVRSFPKLPDDPGFVEKCRHLGKSENMPDGESEGDVPEGEDATGESEGTAEPDPSSLQESSDEMASEKIEKTTINVFIQTLARVIEVVKELRAETGRLCEQHRSFSGDVVEKVETMLAGSKGDLDALTAMMSKLEGDMIDTLEKGLFKRLEEGMVVRLEEKMLGRLETGLSDRLMAGLSIRLEEGTIGLLKEEVAARMEKGILSQMERRIREGLERSMPGLLMKALVTALDQLPKRGPEKPAVKQDKGARKSSSDDVTAQKGAPGDGQRETDR